VGPKTIDTGWWCYNKSGYNVVKWQAGGWVVRLGKIL